MVTEAMIEMLFFLYRKAGSYVLTPEVELLRKQGYIRWDHSYWELTQKGLQVIQG